MNGRDHAIFLCPRDQGNVIKRSLNRSESSLCEPHAFGCDFFEVLLLKTWFQNHRPGMNTHAAWPVLLVALHRSYCQCLDAFRIRWPARHVDFRSADPRGDAAVHVTIKEADGLLPRCIVSERIVDLGV